MTKVKPNPLNVEVLVEKARYKNVVVLPVEHSKFPSLVKIEKAPAKIKSLIGKQYITPQKAQIAIDLLLTEKNIGKSAKAVKSELSSIGLIAEVDKAW
jgi:hypothetical protein|tara:strand:+ start:349 stop:642 length:294 start_codon:yes stop_codon:yes gene_type:complete